MLVDITEYTVKEDDIIIFHNPYVHYPHLTWGVVKEITKESVLIWQEHPHTNNIQLTVVPTEKNLFHVLKTFEYTQEMSDFKERCLKEIDKVPSIR